MRRKSLVFLLCCMFAMSSLAAGQRYTITDLGPLEPTGINSWAQVIGNYNGRAYTWTKWGGFRNLGLLPGGTFSQATAINDRGWVVGTGNGPGIVISPFPGRSNEQCNDLTQPFLWTPSQGMLALGAVAVSSSLSSWCGLPFHGSGLNDSGQVVGYNDDMGTTYQDAFIWTRSAGMTLLGPNYPPSMTHDINMKGEIAGEACTNSIEIGHASTWKDDTRTDLGTLDAGANTTEELWASGADGVDNVGRVVGWSSTLPVYIAYQGYQTVPVHAVIWNSSGVIRDLGTLGGDTSSAAYKINLFGLVIGSSGNFDWAMWQPHGAPFEVPGRPFFWSERTGMQELNTLIPQNSGWLLKTTTDINVWGQIVGSGTRNGHRHGFLLTPLNPFQVF